MSTEAASGEYDAFKFGTLEQRTPVDELRIFGHGAKGIEEWRARRDSNPQPLDP